MAVDLASYLKDAIVVNCDSRQIYKDLDIGTGKVPGQWQQGVFYYQDIPHFLIDYVDPKLNYTLVQYIQDFVYLIAKTSTKYVILTGGTGLYAKAIVEQYDLGVIKQEFIVEFNELKKSLSELNLTDLQITFQDLLKTHVVDTSLSFLNESDYQNTRRLVSRILKIKAKLNSWAKDITYPEFEQIFQFAIEIDQAQLKQNISTRLQQRINQGLVTEVQSLQYLGHDRLLDLGLEYRLTQMYLEGEIDQIEWQNRLQIENFQYAKRQLTWLKKQKDLVWIKDLRGVKGF